jgi:hypothetical protein
MTQVHAGICVMKASAAITPACMARMYRMPSAA